MRLKDCKTKSVFLCELIHGEGPLTERVNELYAEGWDASELEIETMALAAEAYAETLYRITGVTSTCVCRK